MMSIGDLLGERIIEQAKEVGVGLITQEDYEVLLEKSQKARNSLPRLKRKLRTAQRNFSSLPIVRKVNIGQKELDVLFKELNEAKSQNRPVGRIWKEIKALKREISEMRNTRTFRRGVVKINSLKNRIASHANDISCGNVDERRATFDKKGNAFRIAHEWHETIRKGENKGHGHCKSHCEICNEMRKAQRNLNFYGQGDIRFPVSLT